MFLAAEHGALAIALLSGFGWMALHGWALGQVRWLALKIGLVAFLIVPLEGFHAYVGHVFLPRARRLRAERQIGRGEGLDAMVRAIAIPLFGVAVPLLFWLSIRKPF